MIHTRGIISSFSDVLVVANTHAVAVTTLRSHVRIWTWYGFAVRASQVCVR